MKIVKLFFCLIGYATILPTTDAQASGDESDRVYSAEELKEDFQLLRFNIETVHAGLYAYTAKDSLDQIFDLIEESLSTPMTAIGFYRQIIPLHRVIKNGHTAFLPSLSYDGKYRSTFPLFPFDVYWDRGALYILRNNSSNENIKVGARINSINGEPAHIVFDEFVNNWTRDGYNITKPIADVMNNFRLFYIYFKGAPEYYIIDITNMDGTTETLEIPALTRSQISENQLARYSEGNLSGIEKNENALLFEIKNEVAAMTIKSFTINDYKRGKQSYKRFYKESFTKINDQGISHLILDLRNNTGGEGEPTSELLSYLVDEPFAINKTITSVIRKIPNPKLYQTKSIAWRNPTAFVYLRKNGDVYDVKWEYGLKPTKPSTPNYEGAIYVLMNADSFSATGECISFMKNAGIGTFIGEEAGGNAYQNSSGFRPILELPNTKVRALIPMFLYEMNVDFVNTGHGVLPDYPMRPSIDEVLDEDDIAYNFALKLIAEQKLTRD